MGEQDRTKMQTQTPQFAENRRCLTRVDDKRIAEIVVQHPDVVVGEGR